MKWIIGIIVVVAIAWYAYSTMRTEETPIVEEETAVINVEDMTGTVVGEVVEEATEEVVE
jgi:hypothetical protein